jgi:hypothetical protein
MTLHPSRWHSTGVAYGPGPRPDDPPVPTGRVQHTSCCPRISSVRKSSIRPSSAPTTSRIGRSTRAVSSTLELQRRPVADHQLHRSAELAPAEALRALAGDQQRLVDVVVQDRPNPLEIEEAG